jgi:hypothetical protein
LTTTIDSGLALLIVGLDALEVLLDEPAQVSRPAFMAAWMRAIVVSSS